MIISVAAGLHVGLGGRRWSFVVVIVVIFHRLPSPSLFLPPGGCRVVKEGVVTDAFLFIAGIAIFIAVVDSFGVTIVIQDVVAFSFSFIGALLSIGRRGRSLRRAP